MRFRFHRASLQDALKTCVTMPATRQAIAEHCKLVSKLPVVHEHEIKVRYYCGRDDRIGWAAVYIVSGRHGVIGFCDEAVPP